MKESKKTHMVCVCVPIETYERIKKVAEENYQAVGTQLLILAEKALKTKVEK